MDLNNLNDSFDDDLPVNLRDDDEHYITPSRTMKASLCIIAICITAAVTAAPFDEIEPKQAVPNYRLPVSVLPTNYAIEIEPFFDTGAANNFTFTGTATITLQTALTGLRQIVLHINNLVIDEQQTILRLASSPSSVIVVAALPWDNTTHKYTLDLMTPLAPNTDYQLIFKYTGILSEDMYGFYRSSYLQNNVRKWLGTTQMQPTHARRVFPCFDEPSFKATFDISIIRPNTHTTVSNTEIRDTQVFTDGTLRTREVFARTPRMSTYLVAFIVSEFQSRTTGNFSVIARPDASDQTFYAHSIGPKLLAQLETYLAFPYASMGMTKMTMAALPDFSAGAMENFGLLTYRETALLYDSNVSTDLAQQRVATVITHEQAHMWFGDLVTCDWWSYTWLNEGFARYFQYFGTALLEETHWDLPHQFIVEQLQVVMVMDSLEASHPMTKEVNSPSEISGIFDSIAYSKGASVLRMTEHIMGTERFKLSLQQYLEANKFQTTTPQKLYDSLQSNIEESTLQVAQFLNTWTTQSGYPLVTVLRGEDKKTLVISQKRFWLKNATHSDNTRWEIKLNFVTSIAKNFTATQSTFSMTQNQATVNYTLPSEVDWVLFNIQQTGYYRVNYDKDTWENIGRALKTADYSGIHVLNRAQIVDDSLNLARGDLLEYNLALSILQYLEGETNYLPWLAAFNNLVYVQRRFTPTQAELYKKYILRLVDNIFNTLGFDGRSNDTRLDVYNRANILSYACKFGHVGCIESASREFDLLVQSPLYRIPPNVRPIVYCTAITEGTESEWNFMWNRFLLENVAAEQIVILNALGCTKNQTVLELYLDKIITPDVRLQDKSAAFTSAYNGHDTNVQIVLDYVLNNYVAIGTALGDVKSVAPIISNLAARFSTETQISQLERFYTGKESIFGNSDTIPTAIADAKFNLDWANKHVPDIYNYMNAIAGSSKLVSISLLLILSTVITSLINKLIYC